MGLLARRLADAIPSPKPGHDSATKYLHFLIRSARNCVSTVEADNFTKISLTTTGKANMLTATSGQREGSPPHETAFNFYR
jgi:hypothetical protein